MADFEYKFLDFLNIGKRIMNLTLYLPLGLEAATTRLRKIYYLFYLRKLIIWLPVDIVIIVEVVYK